MSDPTDTDDSVSRRRAIGAGLAMLVVVLTYGASNYGDPDRWWAAGAVLVIGITLAEGLDDVRALLPTPGVAPLTLLAALGAAALCVPETDQLPIVALLPVALIALEVVERRQLGIEWYAVATTAVGWGAMFGATGRQSALVGALFAWWPMLLPVLVDRARRIDSMSSALGIAGAATAAAVVVARTGGITDSWTVVFASVVVSAAVSLLAAVALTRPGHNAPAD